MYNASRDMDYHASKGSVCVVARQLSLVTFGLFQVTKQIYAKFKSFVAKAYYVFTKLSSEVWTIVFFFFFFFFFFLLLFLLKYVLTINPI